MKSIHQFWDALSAFGSHLSSVSVEALLLALGFHLANLLLRSNAWRNILLAAHPQPRVRRRTVTGAYLAGVGVNAVIPARYRRRRPSRSPNVAAVRRSPAIGSA